MNDPTNDPFRLRDVADAPPAQLFMHACSIAFEGARRMQAEAMRFHAARAAKDIAFAERCAACATPAELFDAGSSFALEASEDYLAQTMKLFGLAAEQFENSASAVL